MKKTVGVIADAGQEIEVYCADCGQPLNFECAEVEGLINIDAEPCAYCIKNIDEDE